MINIIVAVSNNGVIGNGNKLPWKISWDLNKFKSLTTSNVVIMGRKTFESIGSKPLPNRRNIVLSKKMIDTSIPDIEIFSSLNDAITNCKDEKKEIFICGGESVYREALLISDRIYMTRVLVDIKGDAFFPEFSTLLNPKENHPVYTQALEPIYVQSSNKNQYDCIWQVYDRVK